MTILGILFAVLVLCVVYWAATRLLAAFDVGDPIYTVVVVAIVLLLFLWFLNYFTATPHIPLR